MLIIIMRVEQLLVYLFVRSSLIYLFCNCWSTKRQILDYLYFSLLEASIG